MNWQEMLRQVVFGFFFGTGFSLAHWVLSKILK
jgi:hypothetical protein